MWWYVPMSEQIGPDSIVTHGSQRRRVTWRSVLGDGSTKAIGQRPLTIFTQPEASQAIAEPNHSLATRSTHTCKSSAYSTFTLILYADTNLTHASTHALHDHPLHEYTNRNHGTWKVGYVIFLLCAHEQSPHVAGHQFTAANHAQTDDEEEDSTPPTSPPSKPIARRGKFDDEEDDSDVRQPTMPRAAQLLPHHAQRHTY